MPTVAEALARWREIKSDSARLDVELLLCHVLRKDRTWLFTWPEQTLDDAQSEQFSALLARRIAGEPLAHLTGQRDFWTLSLKVNNSTLIPRPDTETLVDWALGLDLAETARVLDLGTGTGAIALALASERPDWHITGTDISADAIALAKTNAEQNNLAVDFLVSHWFDALTHEHFDLIVSNPPYIAENDPHLTEGDLRFEPKRALVAAQQGLADIAHICRHAGRFLQDSGWLGIEHGYDQADAVARLLRESGFQQIHCVHDLAGHARVSVGQWQEIAHEQ